MRAPNSATPYTHVVGLTILAEEGEEGRFVFEECGGGLGDEVGGEDGDKLGVYCLEDFSGEGDESRL